ncbi:energy-coupling factor transporter transmembrane component T family protein [Ktedonospora formicarum]|uniref:Energy-coupling factor transporter transmembrane protein EcfT n=1 Tax=Ktedonospora formicarum TaxID=2778364 RepID=A0A8J3I6P5_9CHLR|nr:energy-coupling factor transporter transmembrane component T [Ktedonospora formicarum]GHO46414.1 hypothetical protein KSX_45770 [Ktedonospora formicarum]
MKGSKSLDAPVPAFLEVPPGRRYVRSFLFSRRIDAPFAQLHLLIRFVLVACISIVQLRSIDVAHPDPLGAALLSLLALGLFLGSGMHARVAQVYILLTIPTLISLFSTWIIFNAVPGRVILLQTQVYAGHIDLGLSVWLGLWLVLVLGYFLWTRKLLLGIVLATLVAFVGSRLWTLPGWTLAQLPFFHPLTLVVSDRGLYIAITKVIGYSGLIFSTVALVVSSRDAELIGAFRQLRVPQPVIFFISTVFRALDLALVDYQTIHQAQVARAVNSRPRDFIRQLRDLASISVPLIAVMIRRSGEMGDALMARGYRVSQGSADFYETQAWRWWDWAALIFCVVLLYLSFGPHVNLTDLL